MIKGRGYPDICTVHFLEWLAGRLQERVQPDLRPDNNPDPHPRPVPFYALVDADPYGKFLIFKLL
jgi:hypothetical protein